MIEISTSVLPVISIAIPLIVAILVLIFYKNPNIRESITILGSFATFLSVLYIYTFIKDGIILEYTLLKFLPGISLKLKVDAFGVFFALMASFLWFLTTFYSIGYLRDGGEKNQTRFYTFFAIAMFAAIGAAFSGNLLTLYIFYEIITFSTYPLVAHKQTKEAIQGARRYLAYLLITSILFLLPAIIYIYTVSGDLEFVTGGFLSNIGGLNKTILGIMLLFFVFGSAKAAVMPFHLWLPSAMVAPTPVSALLHAVAVVKTGVFLIIRVFVYVYGVDFLMNISTVNIVSFFAAFTIIVASLVALRQDNIKARLAYSTISQLSYIVLAVSLLSINGVIGSIMHIVAHGFGKITLFFWAGAVYVANHKTNVSELDGIGKYMPYSTAAFTLAAMSMIGFPPMAGLISKFYIASGAIEASKEWVLVVLIISAILNASYFVPIFIRAYFKKETFHSGSNHKMCEASPLMVVPLLITAIMTIVIFFWPYIFIDLAKMAVSGGG